MFIVTGGWIESKMSSVTEMMTNYKRWEIIETARLPVPMVEFAALTINNKVYIFGKTFLRYVIVYGCLSHFWKN